MIDFCFKCRGRMCPKGGCILKQRLKINTEVNKDMKKEFSGENYNVFVGRYGYPHINVGLINTQTSEKNQNVDNPLLWAEQNYEISDIIKLRTNLVNSNFKTDIKATENRFKELSQELSLAARPVDTEIILEKKPQIKLTLNSDIAPYGASIRLERARITENVFIPKKVDDVINDELTATESLNILNSKGVDEHYLTKIFSMGNLGKEVNRKLVPTRWSITAVDDTLGKQIIKEVKDYTPADFQLYFGGYLGNYYIIMFFPDVWSYELFETQTQGTEVWHDYETYQGRKDYASSTVGGYYAARIGMLKRLQSIKRQAKILALRLVTPDYWAPLGVWVVREAVKKAMSAKPIMFETREDMIKYAIELAKQKFNYDLNKLTNESILLQQINTQKKLIEY